MIRNIQRLPNESPLLPQNLHDVPPRLRKPPQNLSSAKPRINAGLETTPQEFQTLLVQEMKPRAGSASDKKPREPGVLYRGATMNALYDPLFARSLFVFADVVLFQ